MPWFKKAPVRLNAADRVRAKSIMRRMLKKTEKCVKFTDHHVAEPRLDSEQEMSQVQEFAVGELRVRVIIVVKKGS